jgi:hypothetical protein
MLPDFFGWRVEGQDNTVDSHLARQARKKLRVLGTKI